MVIETLRGLLLTVTKTRPIDEAIVTSGAFNLQAAWSTGFVAGNFAAQL